MNELWADITGYEGLYAVSNTGKIKSYRRRKLLACAPDRDGYRRFNLSVHQRTKKVGVHRMVAIHFVPNPNNLTEVNHKDGDKFNNHASNLEWCTSAQNMRHSHWVLGIKYAKGERVCGAKLTGDEVYEIRSLLKQGHTHRTIACKFNVSETCISKIKRNERWKHLKDNSKPVISLKNRSLKSPETLV